MDQSCPPSMKDPQSFAVLLCDISPPTMSIVIWQRGFQVGQMEGVRSTAHRRTRVYIQINVGGRGAFAVAKGNVNSPGISDPWNIASMEGRSSINEMTCDGIKHAASAERKKPRRPTPTSSCKSSHKGCQWVG